MKKWITILISSAISVFVICLLSIWGVITYMESDHALNKLESLMSQHIPGEIHVKKVLINIWKPEIQFHQVLIVSHNQHPVIGCETIRLELTLSQLLSDPIKIKRFSLIHPWVFLPVSQEKPLNFDRLAPFFGFINQLIRQRIFPGNKIMKSSSLVVDSLNIENGNVLFSQKARPNIWSLEQVNISAYEDRLDMSGHLNYVTSQSSPFHVFQLATTGVFSQNTIAQQLIHLMSSQSPDIFYERLQSIQEQLQFQTNGNLTLDKELFQQLEAFSSIISGNIKGTFDINAMSKEPQINVSIDYTGGSIHSIPVNHIEFKANASNHLITLNRLKAKTQTGELDIQGLIDLKNLLSDSIFPNKHKLDQVPYHFTVQSKKLALNTFFPFFSPECLIDGTLNVKGQGIDPESFISEITLHSSTQLPETIKLKQDSALNLQAKARVEAGVLTLTSLTAITEGMSLTGLGFLSLRPENTGQLSLDIHSSLKWLYLFNAPDMAGDLKASLQINKSADEIKANIHLNGNQLSLMEYHLGDLSANASVSSKGIFTIQNSTLSQLSSSIETSGFVRWKDWSSCFKKLPDSYRISIHSDEININEWHPALKGKMIVNGDIKGDSDRPQGNIDIQGASLSIFGQRVSSLSIPILLSDQKVCMDEGKIEIVPNEKISIAGCLNNKQQYSLDINGNKISFSHLNWQLPGLKGQLSINLDGNGFIKQPQLTGDILVSNLSFKDQPLPDTKIHISSKNDNITINGESLLNFNGFYQMKKHFFQLNAQAENMKLAPFFASAGFSKLDGFFTGKFQLNGNIDDIHNAKTHLSIEKSTLLYQDIPVAWMENFNLDVDHQVIKSTQNILNFPNGGFCQNTFSGKFPENATIEMTSKIPLVALSTIIDSIGDIEGNLMVKGSINHIFNNPMFEGQIKLTDGDYIIPWNNQRIHNIQAELNASQHIFSLKQLSFGIDEGKCDLKGKMILSNAKPKHININLSASAIPIHIPDCADILLNANLNYDQKYRQSLLSGTVEFLETLYYQELSVNQMLLERFQKTRRPTVLDTVCKTFPKICGTSLNINIQSRQPMITDNDLAYLELQPDLNIRGTVFQPVAIGRAEIVTGEINYLSKNFVLEKGLIDFVNPYRMEPLIDIESSVNVRDWQINLDVLGKLDELQVKLSSTPSEEHADIISILLFGKPAHQLFTPSNGPYKSNQQMIAELLSSAFEKDIKQTTGLDTFKLEALEHETTEDNQPDDYKVTLGKELSRRMSITYAFETRNGQLIHHTVADYKILENLLLRGMQDTQGAYGGELLFRMEFRQMPGL